MNVKTTTVFKKRLDMILKDILIDFKHDGPDKVLAYKGPELDCWNLAQCASERVTLYLPEASTTGLC